MARRKNNANASSLDLFLDTICNAFGGIVFISILISILAQMQGGSSTPEETPTITKEKAAEITQEVTELQSERTRLIAMIQKLERDQLGGDQTELLDMLKQMEDSQKKLDDVVSQQTQASNKLSDIQSEVEKLQEEAEKVERELSDAQAALVAQTKSLDDALDALEQKVQLSKARVTRKSFVFMVMRFEKIYLVTDLSKANAEDLFTEHVEKLVTNSGVSIRPKPDAGWPWKDSQTLPRFRSAIAARKPSECFIEIAVWPDSFDTFGKFKQTIVELGYEYELLPLTDLPSLPIQNSSAMPLVQ